MPYKKIILKVLEEYGDWIPSCQFINRKTDYGWLGQSAGRRLRELAEAGKIERRINGRYVEYRAKPENNLPSAFKENPQPINTKQPSFL